MSQVADRLGRRQLVWAGIRGDDIEPLRDVPQLAASYSIAGAYTGRSDVDGVAYDQITKTRVDPEIWDIDDHHEDDATVEFRRGLLRALSPESALLPYRPSNFLSAIHFARRDRCLNLGLFGAHQSAFEHKPFVESAVADMGIPHIPWTYIADEEQLQTRDLVGTGPLMLRRSRTSGGEGMVRVESANEIAAQWPKVDEAFVSVAPFIDGGLPVNVGATVWANAPLDDCVTVHHPSVQLIGIESCVTREFGYCGNDFGLARDLDRKAIDQIERSTKRIGSWLRGNGYVGTFGVDYLVKDGEPLFTEVNARFQGSTHASCRLSIEQGEACLMLEHVASWLGAEKPVERPLHDRVQEMRDLTNLVVHWVGKESKTVEAPQLHADVIASGPFEVRGDVLVPRDVASEPGSLIARLSIAKRLTTNGFDLDRSVDSAIRSWNTSTGVA